MSNTPPQPPVQQNNEPSLSDRTASGVAWVTSQVFATKAVRMLGQIVLAWLLVPSEFGLIGLAMTASAFTGLIQKLGLNTILIHRGQHFRRWANAAFWISLILGVGQAVVLLLLAPVVAEVYGADEIRGLLYVIAVTVPISAITVVPGAALQGEMRFKLLSVLDLISAVGHIILSIFFAWCGCSAYSFVLPGLIVQPMRLIVMWWLARPPIRMDLHLRRWRFLVGDGAKLFTGNLALTLIDQGDYIVLGLLFTEGVVGLYYFAFSLSRQTVQLVTSGLFRVLFPALSQLRDDPKRQVDSYLRVARLLAVVGVPACFLQAALAGPGIRALFDARWYPAIPVIQMISVGMAFIVIGVSAGSLIQAQGRFGTKLVANVAYAVAFMVMIWIGAQWGGMLGLAGAVALHRSLMGVVNMYIAIRPQGGAGRDIWRTFAVPVGGGGVAVVVGVWVSELIPEMRGRLWLQMMGICVCSVGLYLPIVRWTVPEVYRELLARVWRSGTNNIAA